MTTNWTEEMIEAGPSLWVPGRVYRPQKDADEAACVLHLHGGAFIGGSLESGRTVATLLADAGALVISIDYPLAPTHPFPQALQTSFETLSWLYKNRRHWTRSKLGMFVAGEEAGGNIAASLALMARDQQAPPLAGQILLSPMLDPCMATCSIRRVEAGPVGCTWADGWHAYLGSAEKAAHPYAAPLGSSRLARLAPALVVTADDDPMRDESVRYARRLQDAGVPVREHVLAGPTGWPAALGRATAADTAWATTLRQTFTAFFADALSALHRPVPIQA
jgi:acetyl esterase/lipase